MPRQIPTFDAVRTIGKGMPDVESGKAYGSLAIKRRGKLLACMASRSAEPHTLVVVVPLF